MMHQVDLYGVFIPTLLIFAVAALGAVTLVRRALARIGFYRWVWHRPLFDAALYLSVLGLVVLFAQRSLS